jgi:hypothetical protein
MKYGNYELTMPAQIQLIVFNCGRCATCSRNLGRQVLHRSVLHCFMLCNLAGSRDMPIGKGDP